MGHLLLYGNAYAQIIRDSTGQIKELYPLLPDKMDVSRDEQGRIYYTYWPDRDAANQQEKGGGTVLRYDEVLHIPGLSFDGLEGYSPVALAKNVIDLFHSIKPPYRIHAKFLTHDSTLKHLRKLKDNNGQYLWQPAVKEGMPDTILGKPVYISPFVPEIASGTTPIAFGDFSYYWIADRRDVRFKV